MFVGYGIHVFIYVHISIYSMIKSYAIAKYMMFFFQVMCTHAYQLYSTRERWGNDARGIVFCSDLSRTGNQADRN